MALHPADREARDRLFAAAPCWSGVRRAKEAIGLESHVLLHSGPPAENGHVVPTLHSAAVACVFEGWAADFDEADELIASGDVRLEPAQDRNVATPLAAVVSASMQVIEVSDGAGSGKPAYAPLNGGGTGGAPAARYGRKSQEALDLLRFLNEEVAGIIAPAASEPIPWLPIIDAALTRGDDVHLRHLEAHKTLVEVLRKRLPSAFGASNIGTFVAEWPIFHLNFWMAAARCALSAAAGVKESALVTAMGGNGAQFGLQVSGLPGRWFIAPADVPRGDVREPYTMENCTGAYGDSALAEGFGLGAMALSYCPDMKALHSGYYDDSIFMLPEKLLIDAHPGFPASGARAGLSARAVVETGETPVVELGLVEKSGVYGGLGAGLYRPPLASFEAACAALNED
ncbi:MAG: hypothetical protein CMM55_10735 [Rhodospirillaceae bacterium]|nr:hypothetical protein [Rhodospirillaceae bacterium]